MRMTLAERFNFHFGTDFTPEEVDDILCGVEDSADEESEKIYANIEAALDRRIENEISRNNFGSRN